ncbi:hypothetical protein C5B42_03630 [Candidatus Cerribacteria bacterium 'Amazon FNV 2010 28 9']|uniref:Uncharacterized protein n=1 Tax=Candidatus Cerribacteria bacterium 'Amazon FNV 2010 28 9' TaxID=2081795 RepID=A0A317JPQ0_9BACT|nr:MAG: hypothetical protein C5B42_03630 [Candidatus Cerribacteria bacterium 'Amazon FNV 2010 28 9']
MKRHIVQESLVCFVVFTLLLLCVFIEQAVGLTGATAWFFFLLVQRRLSLRFLVPLSLIVDIFLFRPLGITLLGISLVLFVRSLSFSKHAQWWVEWCVQLCIVIVFAVGIDHIHPTVLMSIIPGSIVLAHVLRRSRRKQETVFS